MKQKYLLKKMTISILTYKSFDINFCEEKDIHLTTVIFEDKNVLMYWFLDRIWRFMPFLVRRMVSSFFYFTNVTQNILLKKNKSS